MRTITNLHDLYLAFAELHSCCAILTSGERTEYNLGDGHIAYLTCDEREFLDAIETLETKTGETTEVPVLTRNPDLDITGGLCQTIADSTRAMHPGVDTTKPLTLFTAYTLLKRRGITGKNRKRPPSEDTAKAVEVVSTSIEKAVNSVLKKMQEGLSIGPQQVPARKDIRVCCRIRLGRPRRPVREGSVTRCQQARMLRQRGCVRLVPL